MIAKYATTCAACGQAVNPGDEIVSVGTGRDARWVHDRCAVATQDALFDGAVQRPAPPARRTARARPPDMPTPDGATTVFTDGACKGNPGPGGWAWAVSDGRHDAGGHPATTNQRMEIQAAFEAVRAISDSPLVVASDSTYVVNCFRDGWWRGWHARGWRTAAKQPVANRDLWEPFVDLVNQRGDVTFRWVKGHSGDPMNDLVDRLAVEQAALHAASLPER